MSETPERPEEKPKLGPYEIPMFGKWTAWFMAFCVALSVGLIIAAILILGSK